jgi:hypothetical protein
MIAADTIESRLISGKKSLVDIFFILPRRG